MGSGTSRVMTSKLKIGDLVVYGRELISTGEPLIILEFNEERFYHSENGSYLTAVVLDSNNDVSQVCADYLIRWQDWDGKLRHKVD